MNAVLNNTTFAALLPIPAASVVSSWSPSTAFADWAEDGTNISVPISSFTDLTAALADGTTGDARQVILSIAKTAFEWYNELTPKPEALVLSHVPGRMQGSGDFAGKQKAEYKVVVYMDYPEGTITAEPEA